MKTIRLGWLVLLSGVPLAANIAHAQGAWTVTVTPTMNPLPIGFCAAVQLTILDASGRDAPRNANGSRVTMADFDMSVSGASVAGRQIDSTHFEVCGCQGGSAGSRATVTATYPAKALATPAVPGFQRTAPFALAAANGATNPPACASNERTSISARPQPLSTAALPSVAAPVTVAPVPGLNPATPPPTAVSLPPVAPRAPLDTYKPGPVTVSFPLSATGSWYEPGPVTVNFGLNAQGSWYEPGPVTITFNLSASGNWIERAQTPPPPVQPAPPGL